MVVPLRIGGMGLTHTPYNGSIVDQIVQQMLSTNRTVDCFGMQRVNRKPFQLATLGSVGNMSHEASDVILAFRSGDLTERSAAGRMGPRSSQLTFYDWMRAKTRIRQVALQ